MNGIVIKSTGNEYYVREESGKIVICKLRGQFRIKRIKTTNPIAVGDRVQFKLSDDQNFGIISKIENRKNYIARKSVNLSKISHILAANIDCLILMASVNKPRTPLGFIDRFLIAAESFRIESILVFNKIDLCDETDNKELNRLVNIYEKIGYKCLKVSATERTGLSELKKCLKDKVSLIGGQSGVGKSSLINALDNNLKLKTDDISNNCEKGKHTTTFAEMFHLTFGCDVIDSPGIKEFGLIQYEKEEVCHYFPEMLSLLNKCKFNNCTHTHEPQCAVKEAVESGKIEMSRYQNYLSIVKNEDLNLKDWMLE